MTEPISREFSKRVAVVRYLIDRFPRQEVSASTARAYAEDLIDVDEADLWPAVKLIARRSDFFPSLAEIFRAVADVRDARENIPAAEDAWVWAAALIPEGGPGRGGVPAGMELADAAIRSIGGWEQLGQGQVTDRQWRRKEFLQAYAALLQRRRDGLVGGSQALDELEPQRLLERSGTMTKCDATGILGMIQAAAGRQ